MQYTITHGASTLAKVLNSCPSYNMIYIFNGFVACIGGLGAGVISGITIAILALIGAVVIGVYCIRRHRPKGEHRNKMIQFAIKHYLFSYICIKYF